MPLVLGVDGGNTKTDYRLADETGRTLASLRAGTCSHEALGAEGARREMGLRMQELLEHSGHRVGEVRHAVFGLAGIDQPAQERMMTAICRNLLGHDRALAVNDSLLGIKAGLPGGYGVCSINGTGTCAGGVGTDGARVQVGGLGPLTGDDAGGSYLAMRTLRAVYEALFRFGPETSLTPRVLARFGCADERDVQEAFSTKFQYGRAVTALDATTMLFEEAARGDKVARGIVLHVADSLARGAAGCAARLRLPEPVPVILIGSVWTKGRQPLMRAHFQARMERYCGLSCDIRTLEAPPVSGAVLWAMELAAGRPPEGEARARALAEA